MQKRQVMKKPLFSILMPAYNVAKYIREAVESIQKQSFEDWELIIVDDCSKDNTADIIKELASLDKRIRVAYRNENSGKVHVPRCEAAGLAVGEYVVPIDADDKVASGFLSTLARCVKNGSPDLVIPEMWRFANDGEPYKLLPDIDVATERVWDGKDLVKLTLVNWRIPMCGFACRRDLYLAGDPDLTNEEESTLYADELFSRILLLRSKRVTFCEARYLYRLNPTSITNVNAFRFGCFDSDRWLAEMMGRLMGQGSEEHLLAEEQLFWRAVEALRTCNKGGLPKDEVRSIVKLASSVMKDLNLYRFKGRVSVRYLMLMSLPVPVARRALGVIDYLMLKTGVSFRTR